MGRRLERYRTHARLHLPPRKSPFPAQQNALQSIREAAREAGMTVFLTGGAVRDLTSGSPVRDLDVSVQGKAFELKPKLNRRARCSGANTAPSHTLFARFPGGVRVEVSGTRREEFPKPGKPVYHPGSILDDLRRRDFTANAMALSLNEGSYGLLMDPLNGVADLEARLLRLVSNYGFLEDPIRLIRAARLQARLGWELEEKTKARFENAKAEGVISLITPYQQGYEVEEIVHEEDGLKVLKALEADGWMKVLFPAWTSAKVDVRGPRSSARGPGAIPDAGGQPRPVRGAGAVAHRKIVGQGPCRAEEDVCPAGLRQRVGEPGRPRQGGRQAPDRQRSGDSLGGLEAASPPPIPKRCSGLD